MARIIINIVVAMAVIISICGMYLEANATGAEVNTLWTKETQNKLDNLTRIGFEPTFARSLIMECKRMAVSPVNCIKIGASVAGAESSMGHFCHRNNCVGMNDGAVGYSSIKEGVSAWVGKYNKFWYKQKTPKSFYRDDGIPPITRYCMGKKKDGVCKEGTKNSWAVFNSINF